MFNKQNLLLKTKYIGLKIKSNIQTVHPPCVVGLEQYQTDQSTQFSLFYQCTIVLGWPYMANEFVLIFQTVLMFQCFLVLSKSRYWLLNLSRLKQCLNSVFVFENQIMGLYQSQNQSSSMTFGLTQKTQVDLFSKSHINTGRNSRSILDG